MSRLFIGLISGTSMDGVDAALVDFQGKRPRLIASHAHPYEPALAKRLRRAGGHTTVAELTALDTSVADSFVAAVKALLAEAGVEALEIEGIGSHGQTIWHAADRDPPATVQIGDPNRIVEGTGITTVADFRRRDIALGGQGAPLAPAFHAGLLDPVAEGAVVVANIGGIGNITRLPRTPSDALLGFDTGPGNGLMDAWIRRHLGKDYDANGEWARGGRILGDLLARLLADPYLARPAPKSTGPEHYNLGWLDRQLAGGEAPRDVMATLAEFTARSLADEVPEDTSVLAVCGGGAHNGHLMARLQTLLPGMAVHATDAFGVPVDWMEAMGFAWLARAAIDRQPGNAPSVTGAERPAILGGIYPILPPRGPQSG